MCSEGYISIHYTFDDYELNYEYILGSKNFMNSSPTPHT